MLKTRTAWVLLRTSNLGVRCYSAHHEHKRIQSRKCKISQPERTIDETMQNHRMVSPAEMGHEREPERRESARWRL
jgi:hypothetical protein